MTAIAIELPEEVQVASDGIIAFAEQEVMPRHAKMADLFEDPPRLYDNTGRFSKELIAVITEVRMASAQAGLQGAQLRAKGAQGLMGLVGQGQGLTAQQLGLLQGVGGAQQAMGQSSLDLAYQDFMNQQNHPYKQLGFMSDILRETPYGSTQVYSQPGPSPMQSMAGLGIAGLGLYGMGGGFTPGGFSFNQMGQNMFGM